MDGKTPFKHSTEIIFILTEPELYIKKMFLKMIAKS